MLSRLSGGRAASLQLLSAPDGSGMVLRGACLLLCLVSLAQVSGQQNGKGRQKPAAAKKGEQRLGDPAWLGGDAISLVV